MTHPQTPRTSRPVRSALVLTALGVAAIALAGLSARRPAPAPSPSPVADALEERPIIPLFARTVPAANQAGLALTVDPQKVLGWISGRESHAGREVTVTAGDCTETVTVQSNNTFTWFYNVPRETVAAFRIGKLGRSITLRPPGKPEPSVFFVVDRTAYRPGHVLSFAGFLRELDRRERFTPLAGRPVEIVLASGQKKAVAARIKLTSDDFGRVAGSYTFTPADVLDEYTLWIPGFSGQAVVKLAEFRKAKVRLDISGKPEGRKLRLCFEARDFLDKPVAAQSVQFTAKVFHRESLRPGVPGHALDAGQFVYADKDPCWLSDPDELTPEQLHRWVHEGVWPRIGESLVAQIGGRIELGSEPRGMHDLVLDDAWLDGRSVVQVEGVLVDQNGREQRATRTISLADGPVGNRPRLAIDLPRRVFLTREPIPLTVRLFDAQGKECDVPGDTAVVVMRHTYQPLYGAVWDYPNQIGQLDQIYRSNRAYAGPYGHYRGLSASAVHSSAMPRGWTAYRQVRQTPGELVTAAAVRGGKASVGPAEPGTYELIAVSHLPDGTALREETFCTVLADEGRGLSLKLDKADYQAGDVVTGEIHSRFRGAVLLLTLRDSRGLRLWRTLTLDGGAMRFQQRLPADLNYGCTLVVQYADRDDVVHTAHANFRVTPGDRILEIDARMKEVVEPGEKMKIHLKVNRNEPVDLVVSVYDQSLLGIAPGKSPDIRSFYLADERAFGDTAADLLQRKLGDLTLEQLADQARQVLKEDPKSPRAPLAQEVIQCASRSHLGLAQLATVLEFAGLSVRQYSVGNSWFYPRKVNKGQTNRLLDILGHEHSQWRLRCRFYDDLLVIVEQHPQYRRNPFASHANYAYWPGYDTQGRARADAQYSLSANSMMSVSGQSFISHMPPEQAMPSDTLQPDTPAAKDVLRRDFSDSAYWNACVRTDERGEASVEFKLPDSLTNWHVVVTGVSRDMHVGHRTGSFRTYRPIMVWPMVPRVFTQGDKVRVFARVHNRTDHPQSIRTKLKVHNGTVLDPDSAVVTVRPNDSECVYWTFQPGEPGYTQLLMTAECDAGSDASLKRLPVVPACSVEQLVTVSGFCQDPAAFDVPPEALKQQAGLELTIVGSLAADMLDSLDYLVDYPHGCVEQTMSRFLPAIKVAQILRKAGLRQPSLEKKLPDCVAAGIKRLYQLQHADGGWGWNGSSGTHEMMTPYALYGLLEAQAAGYELPSDEPVERGLGRLRQFIDAMGDQATTDRVYCMYVYTLRKPAQEAWWGFIASQLRNEKLSDYATALALEMAVRLDRKPLASDLAAWLRKRAGAATFRRPGADKAEAHVYWRTAGFSHWGDNPLEITAAALKALVAYDVNDPLIPGVLAYFAANKHGNRWNSTKDTALILFALCDYVAKKDLHLRRDSAVLVRLNDHEPHKVAVAGSKVTKLAIPVEQVHPGSNTIRFSNAAFGTMYRLVFRYRKTGTDVPAFEGGARVARSFHLLDQGGKVLRRLEPGDSIPRGSYLLSDVQVRRTDGQGMSYVLVDSPKPSCCEIVPVDDKRFGQASTHYVLREDKTPGVLHHHESAGAAIQDRCVFYAELAGEYVVPPAYVELMYDTGVRGHSGTFRFRVTEDPQAQ